MNAAEEIVKYWYEKKGYFVMESLKCGRMEIDLLGIKLSDNKKKIVDRIHVGIQVSNRSVNYNKPAWELAKEYHQKFVADKVKAKVKEILGKNYHMVEVRGEVAHGKKNIREEYTALRAKKGAVVIPFEDILKDLMDGFGTNTEFNPVIQTLKFLKYQY